MPTYYKIPPEKWEELRTGAALLLARQLNEDALQRDPGNTFRKRKARERLRRRRKQERFAALVKLCKLDFEFGGPCSCGMNHHLIVLGDEYEFCPISFYVQMCDVILVKSGPTAMDKWAEAHPIKDYLKRIDREKDAIYEDQNWCERAGSLPENGNAGLAAPRS